MASKKKTVNNLVDIPKAAKEIQSADLVNAMLNGYGKNDLSESKEEFSKLLSSYLTQEVSKNKVAKDYNVLVLFDNTRMVKADSDKIYRAITSLTNKEKPLLLVVVSNGGEPGSAYLIGKLCREFCASKFIVAIPRHAKSAATLLSCAADEIHMGSLSELGPIDPQINGMPALGLKNSVEHIAKLVSKTPKSGEMFATYLERTVGPIQIGYYERVAESAVQYAERLLNKRETNLATPANEIAFKLVYGYMDHGFVIDKGEAATIFGTETVKSNTDEYQIGNTVYETLSHMEELAGILDYNFYFIGSLESEPSFLKRKN